MSQAPRSDRFLPAMLRPLAPLLLWSGHFWASYVLVATACSGGWAEAAVGGVPPLRAALLSITAIALLLAAWLLWRACRRHRAEGAALARRAEVAASALGLIGIAWSAVPLLVLPLCHIT